LICQSKNDDEELSGSVCKENGLLLPRCSPSSQVCDALGGPKVTGGASVALLVGIIVGVAVVLIIIAVVFFTIRRRTLKEGEAAMVGGLDGLSKKSRPESNIFGKFKLGANAGPMRKKASWQTDDEAGNLDTFNISEVSASTPAPQQPSYGQQQKSYNGYGQQQESYNGYGQQQESYNGYGQQQQSYNGYGQQQSYNGYGQQ